VIETAGGPGAFVEAARVGRTLTLGDAQLRIDGPCPRCVMTTLSQGSLPKDPSVLRAAVQENGGNVGVYATVVRGGRARRGDAVRLS
jgi:MOSC domain-containing protein